MEKHDYYVTLNNSQRADQRKALSKELKDFIKNRDNYTCQICGKYMPDEVGLEIDHIIPVSKGGKSIPDNLRVLCSKCNRKKGNKIEENIEKKNSNNSNSNLDKRSFLNLSKTVSPPTPESKNAIFPSLLIIYTNLLKNFIKNTQKNKEIKLYFNLKYDIIPSAIAFAVCCFLLSVIKSFLSSSFEIKPISQRIAGTSV